MAGHQVDLVTLQVILFVGNWFLSWGMIAYNSWCLAQGDDGHADMVNAAPVTVLVMGLFMTNLQGYFQEKYKEPKVARAAAMDMDLPLLLWQHGREICSKKPPQAWGRLKVRQALGRGIPLSMISFYLASRHVVETPACQISITAGRPLLEEGVETKLSVRLTDQKEVCSAVLPLGFKIGCRTREDLRQNEILETLHSNKMAPPDVSVNDQESTQNAHLRLIGEAQQKMQMTAEVLFSPTMRQMAANDLWTAGHCTSSSWQLENRNITTSNLCGHEICLHPSPPEGPMQAFNQFAHRAVIEKMKRSDVAQASVLEFLKRLTGKQGWLFRLIPWHVVTDLLSEYMNVNKVGAPVVTWRFWGHDFALGLFSLLSSVLPLASWVAERRGLKTWQTAPVLVHHTIDIMLVEVAAILLLSRRLLDDFGSIFSENLDKIINDLAQALSKVNVAKQFSISDALNNRQAWLPEVQAKLAQNIVEGQDDAANMMVKLAKPLGVDLVTFLPFVGASVLFYSVSTLFVTKCKLTAELPWLTRWNAAVGGPLLLLGAVSRKEVRSQCNGIMKQIAFRGLLLSILLAVLLAPVDEFDTATFTTLVFQRELTRAPFVLSWLTLWAMHILTGIVAVQEIKSHRTQKDIDRHYGTCTPARAEEGHGAAAAATQLPAGQPAGVQYHLPGTPFAGVGGQSPEPLKSQTLRV